MILWKRHYDAVNSLIQSGKYKGTDSGYTEQAVQMPWIKQGHCPKQHYRRDVKDYRPVFKGIYQSGNIDQDRCGKPRIQTETDPEQIKCPADRDFQELVSDNEDADVTELAIQLKSVELTYEASFALSSISYVMKTSLLNFI